MPHTPVPIIVTVDVVLLTLAEERLQVGLIQRETAPFAGQPALPGGYVHADADRDSVDAARRILLRKTGVVPPYLEQLHTFADSRRDPRGWSVSMVYYALIHGDVLQRGAEAGLRLVPVDALPPLAFDHDRIVAKALERLRNKASYSSLPCYLLPEAFTLTELQHTYEQVLGERLDKASFRRKLDTLDFLEALPGRRKLGVHRPAQLYRIRPDRRLALFDRVL